MISSGLVVDARSTRRTRALRTAIDALLLVMLAVSVVALHHETAAPATATADDAQAQIQSPG